MSFSFSHNPSRVYRIVVAIWLLLFALVVALIIAMDLQRAGAVFLGHAEEHYRQANDRVHINESVLEGFAAMIGAAGDMDRSRVRVYARQMLKQYPHIYMFEIVEKVPDERLDAFVEYYRRTLFPEFRVKRFRYETDREWAPVQKRPYHLPIVFMEPFPPQSRDVMGLDISSNGFLMRSLQQSEQLGRAASTAPFRLIEGELAYLLHRPVPVPAGSEVAGRSGAESALAVLVIRADTLLDREGHAFPGMEEELYNPAFSETDPRGYLHVLKGPHRGRLESWLFPRLHTRMVLDSESQPFVLEISQQLGWDVVSWGKLALTLLLAVVTFTVMMVYARIHFRNELERTEMTVKLFHLANHDSLTGLANRNLLQDRLEHAITQAARQNTRLAVLFLDLENFKEVNDSLGHEAGDGVLRRAAERLRACVRAGDTIARLGGDEFVLVLENTRGQEDVDQVIGKIKAGFEQPFSVGSRSVRIGISIGAAIYPQDGTDADTLLRQADAGMYEDKRSAE